MKTSIIKYNLRERGRRYRGTERNFDIPAIVGAINGPECQERVKSRDMLGYYGHWPRVKFGMVPLEGNMATIVQPALVTLSLRAFPDGTVEHEAEFLGTDSGQVAAKLFASRTGGFSSAIDSIKPMFCGFDYVLEPNYSTNRGYALDSVQGASGLTLDAVEAEIQNEQIRGMMMLLDAATVEREMVNQTIERLSAENDYLIAKLAEAGRTVPVLDSIAHSKPLTVSKERGQQLQRDAAFFRASQLPRVLDASEKESRERDREYQRIASRFCR